MPGLDQLNMDIIWGGGAIKLLGHIPARNRLVDLLKFGHNVIV